MDYIIEITDNTNDGETDTTGFMYRFLLRPAPILSPGMFDELNKNIHSWCSENLPHNEYYIDASRMAGILYVYTHTYESSMAFKLTWE